MIINISIGWTLENDKFKDNIILNSFLKITLIKLQCINDF
jgi:hypothetical protein